MNQGGRLFCSEVKPRKASPGTWVVKSAANREDERGPTGRWGQGTRRSLMAELGPLQRASNCQVTGRSKPVLEACASASKAQALEGFGVMTRRTEEGLSDSRSFDLESLADQ